MKTALAVATDPDSIELFLQFGFKRGFRLGQVVKVSIGGKEVGKAGMQFISNPAKRRTECWWAGSIMVAAGETVELETMAGVPGMGPDTERTSHQWFIADPEAEIREIEIDSIGYHGYPLLKGRLRPLSTQSVHEAQLSSLDAVVEAIQ